MRTACVRNEEVREDPFNGQPGGTGEDAVKASDWIAGCLGDWGVDTVFELIGGMTTHLMDSIYREGRSRIITVHHEQAPAMGASLGSGGRPVVVVAGDGGFQCNIQEMQTVARNRIPLKIVVMNNRSLGMVRQFQETYFEGRFPCTVLGYDTPDFRAVAQAYGIEAMSVPDGSRVSRGLEWLWRDPRVPSLLEVSIPRGVGFAPRMVFGKDLDRMYPDRACTGT